MKKLLFCLVLCLFQSAPATGKKGIVRKPSRAPTYSCSGAFLGLPGTTIKTVYSDQATVVLDHGNGLWRVIGSATPIEPGKLELMCLSPREAQALKANVDNSEAVISRIAFPKGAALLCYSTDDIKTECWTWDKGKQRFTTAGYWEMH